ncbi:axoneme-associated protein mst101(2)-like isoform X2 [Palaemon carinicauda]|uniref:axoneme-associated protein mst101(2)-like isoform X2 n=1 Tax=Palaemon carinicauda TaxID=392227 RepID=UPI0035B6965F
MFGLRWVTVGLLVVAAAACVSGSDKREPEEIKGLTENPWILGDTSLAVPAESQQISVVAASDLQASASGHGKGYGKHHKGHKGHKSGYHDKESYKGEKGHKAEKGHKKKHHGDYGKDHKKGYHDKGGKHYKGHEDKHKYYGDEHKGKKGKKGHHYGSKGHHNKGHKDKGFKNVYHKEEYHQQKKYYDDHDKKKYHDKYDDYDSYFKSNKGKDFKGGEYKGDTGDIYSSKAHSQEQIENSLLISRVKAAMERINDIPSNAKDEIYEETGSTVPQETKEDLSGVMRYAGRILLDRSSRGRSRSQRKSFYDQQCQVHDLRKIRRYLMYCVKHSGDVGPPEDGAPPCSEEDLSQIKKYLNFCQMPFLAKASRGDKRQYRKLKVIAKKLDMRNNIIEDEEMYQETEYAAEVCTIMDLRQMKIYLEDCHSHKEPWSGRPSCELANYQKSLEYLSTCEIFFLSKASKRDKRQYNTLLSMASAMIQGEETESTSYEEQPQPEDDCQIGDLREAQKYLNGCKKLMEGKKSKSKYGIKICQSEHLQKINRYLLGCESFFLGEASERDRNKYINLISISETIGMEPGKQSEPEIIESEEDSQTQCKIKDLRKIPRYLRSCNQSKSCDIDQLSKVYQFLVDCEIFFLQSASNRERSKYNELAIKAEMLSTRENIEQWREETVEERKHIESVCKIHVLRKIPKYLRDCYKSRDCKIKRLLKLQQFLGLCEDFFTIAASPKDRGKYAKFLRWSLELVDKGRYREAMKKEEQNRRDKEIRCDLKDLRRVPKYLSECAETNTCRKKQLSKVFKFLFMCEIPFTSTASRRDRSRYRKLMDVSEKLSLNKPVTFKPKKHKKENLRNKCSIKDLRKIPGYLSKCATSKDCKPKRLAKVHMFMRSCKGALTKNASLRDKKKYTQLTTLSKRMSRKIKPRVSHKKKIKEPRVSQKKQRKEQRVSRRKQKRRGTLKKPQCKVPVLKKVKKYLTGCVAKAMSKGRKRKTQRASACGKEKLNKIKKFLLSCRGEFLKKTSKSDRKQYQELISLSRRGIKPQPKGKKQQIEARKSKVCKIRDLRKVPKYLKSCSKAIRQTYKGSENKVCKKETFVKIRNFLNNCQNTFLKRASNKDKKKYKSLAVLSIKLSKQIQRKRGKLTDTEIFPCDKHSLLKLEKHVKHCRAKIKSNKRKERAYRRRKQERARALRAKRQFRKQNRHPSKEKERCKTRWRRARRIYRQGGKYHDKHGKKGHHEKGKYHDDHKGHKGHYDHKGHYGDKSSYGKKGGYKGDYGHEDSKGHGDHHGYGHDDHGHGHGYGHDHHGHGYGHDDHHGHGYMYPAPAPRMPVYCYRRDYCAPFVPPPFYSYPIPYF